MAGLHDKQEQQKGAGVGVTGLLKQGGLALGCQGGRSAWPVVQHGWSGRNCQACLGWRQGAVWGHNEVMGIIA